MAHMPQKNLSKTRASNHNQKKYYIHSTKRKAKKTPFFRTALFFQENPRPGTIDLAVGSGSQYLPEVEGTPVKRPETHNTPAPSGFGLETSFLESPGLAKGKVFLGAYCLSPTPTETKTCHVSLETLFRSGGFVMFEGRV